MGKVKVLSLFDGISCGQVALERVGVEVDEYFASEININSMWITKKNYPDTMHVGDVTKLNHQDLLNIDLLIGGSPCQDFSKCKAGYGKGIKGEKSKLFYEFLRLLKGCKPKYFLLENVPMKQEWEDLISKELGVKPIKINSGLLAAAERERLYWTNIPQVELTEDKCLVLNDIILKPEEVEEKYWYDKPFEYIGYKKVCAMLTIKGHDMIRRVHHPDFQCSTLTTCNGGNLQKKVYQDGKCRKLIPLEYERLQTLPDNYTEGVTDTHRYNGCGDGWTVDVIAHIFKGLIEEEYHDLPYDGEGYSEGKIDLRIEELNSEKEDKTCVTKHGIPPKPKDSGILPNFT